MFQLPNEIVCSGMTNETYRQVSFMNGNIGEEASMMKMWIPVMFVLLMFTISQSGAPQVMNAEVLMCKELLGTDDLGMTHKMTP